MSSTAHFFVLVPYPLPRGSVIFLVHPSHESPASSTKTSFSPHKPAVFWFINPSLFFSRQRERFRDMDKRGDAVTPVVG